MKFVTRCLPFVLAVPLAVAALAPTAAQAQCLLPDRLDCGPCWTPALVQLPTFPTMTQDSLEICWRDCQVGMVEPSVARWGALRPARTATIPPVCSVFVSRLDISVGGVARWSGPIRLWYSRTWFEDSGAQRFQVWRFLANGDLRLLAPGPSPCPIPTCAAAFGGKVHHRGYIDYALDCATGRFSIAWALDHDCDGLHHVPGFPRAGVFHPENSYTKVGPAAGFVPGPGLPIEIGPITDEAFRPLDLSVLPASGAVCIHEEKVEAGSIDPLREFCPCQGPVIGAPQYILSNIGALGVCGTQLQANPAVFPGGFVSKAIGFWGGAGIYPGPEMLRLNLGGYDYRDPCRPRGGQEFFFGVTTFRGYPASRIDCVGAIGAPLPPTFVDQGNSLRFPGFAPVLNVKYASDIILNFNLP